MSEVSVKILNEKAWNLLKNLGFTEDTLNDISKWDILPGIINEFVSSHNVADDSIILGSVSDYNLKTKQICINEAGLESERQYYAVRALAHEVAHALSKKSIDNSSMNDYARTRATMEGEALYHEFMAFHKIYGGTVNNGKLEFNALCWKDDMKIPGYHNYYQELYDIIKPDSAATYTDHEKT